MLDIGWRGYIGCEEKLYPCCPQLRSKRWLFALLFDICIPFICLSVYLFIHFSVINAPVTFWGIIFGLSIYGWMDGWMHTSVHGYDPSLMIIHWPPIPP